MKIKNVIIIGLALAFTGLSTANAQNIGSQKSSPVGPAGPAGKLTPQQRAERQQQIQGWAAELRAKQDKGSITVREQAWLDRKEQRGRLPASVLPQGSRLGGGFGPRAQMGLCPLANTPAAVATPAPAGRSPGIGMGFGGGRGWGRGGGWGLRDGTGPRAQMGLCPLVNTSESVAMPTPAGRGPGAGIGFGGGRGWGRGGGWGLRNGTGPRAQNGTCPLMNPAAK